MRVLCTINLLKLKNDHAMFINMVFLCVFLNLCINLFITYIYVFLVNFLQTPHHLNKKCIVN